MTYYCKKHGAEHQPWVITGYSGSFCRACANDFWREHIGVLTETPPPPDLKPCAHCGSKPILSSDDHFTWVACGECQVMTNNCHRRADAIAKWNKRA